MNGLALALGVPGVGGGASLLTFDWANVVGTLTIAANNAQAATLAADGNNLIGDTDGGEFTTTIADWLASVATLTQEDATVLGIAPSGGADQKIMKVENTATGSGSGYRTGTAVVGGTYSASARAYSPSTNTLSNGARLRLAITALANATVTGEDAWQTLTPANVVATGATWTVLCYSLGTAAIGDETYWDKVVLNQHIALATFESFAHYSLTAKITLPASGVIPFGIVARYSDAANYWYWRITPGTAGNDLDLIKVVAGVATVLASADVDWVAGQSYTLALSQVSNDSHTASVDGVSKINYTTADDFNVAATQIGYRDEAVNNGTLTYLRVSQLPFEGAATRRLTITSPVAYQVIQRNASNQADLVIAGTYAGAAPTSVVASWNGGAWTEIDATPSGNVFSGTLATQTGGQGTLSVRDSGATELTDSVLYVGIGDVFIIGGQSNPSGRGTNNQTYSHATLKASLFGNDYTWKELADPTDSNTGQLDSISVDAATGSLWPLVATLFMADQSVPIAFVPCASGGTSITQWQEAGHAQNRVTLYGSMGHRAILTGAKAVLWWQGETDAINGMAEAVYNTNLDTLANNINSDLGVKLMVCKLQNSSGITDDPNELAINTAINTAWGDNANVLTGPDLTDLASDDSYHLQTNAKLSTASDRWWAALEAAFYTP